LPGRHLADPGLDGVPEGDPVHPSGLDAGGLHEAIEREVERGCRVLYLESPTNPTLNVIDLARLARRLTGIHTEADCIRPPVALQRREPDLKRLDELLDGLGFGRQFRIRARELTT
jgi:hypothetical protein